MYGIFVNETNSMPYARLLAAGVKTIETRNRNMLSVLVGKRVAIVRTMRDRNPVVLGYVTITRSMFCNAEDFGKYENQHFVQPTSKYAPNGRGKWFYFCEDAEKCVPFPLPANAVRHGRSWCEF